MFSLVWKLERKREEKGGGGSHGSQREIGGGKEPRGERKGVRGEVMVG